ncbi:threonine dehydrogenase [Fructobacillus pseudoficulneus]|uniref:Threonine dehydrogenase n=1 Tax=Fructobacillus pseudoficulneus TaxID=220714 RepID=A0A3F3GZT6_9LACO|nr:2,3-butanediol dehydrogenase [Fructobacillus pseudoficulneus]GAP03402.1 threonine dehydrogenase [Fructobacillus pseudoficulneus]SEH46269.1 (R,R)-butanediol dehydrogenase / meso-butanediol dehydrogenase / diacetyl reductase [Fructobacillus pseudoficulneus]
MKAAVWHGAKDVRIEKIELKPLEADEVRVKVAYAGICGSDLHEYQEGPVMIPAAFPDPLTNRQAPLVLGHEFSGIVDEVGADVTGFKPGDHIAVNPVITKNESADDVDVYDGYSFIGLNTDGGFAAYAKVPELNLYHLPEGFPLKEAAVIEPAAVAVQATKEGGLKVGQSVVIFGAGPIGAMLAAVARAVGAAKIVVVDLAEERLAIARKMGATDTVNASHVLNIRDAVRDILPEGADVSFEVAGVQQTFDEGVQSTKPRGSFVIVSIVAHPLSLDVRQLMNSGVRIATSIAYSRETFQQTIDLVVSGQIDVNDIFTSEIRLNDLVHKGIVALMDDKHQEKIIVNLTKEK